MPICERCRMAADGSDYGPVLVCSVCGRGPVKTYTGTGTVIRHKFGLDWCTGSHKLPRESSGHDYCDGCPCQHKPRGSWNARPGQ